MKRMTAIAAAAVLMTLVGFSASALAETTAKNYFPAKIQLTVEQQKLVEVARDHGRDQVVLPLTFNQEEYLENTWDGWQGGMLTVYTKDCHQLLGEAVVIPE